MDDICQLNFCNFTIRVPYNHTINTDAVPDAKKADKCLYDLKAQSCQTMILTNFIDMIDSGTLRFLESKNGGDYAIKDCDR